MNAIPLVRDEVQYVRALKSKLIFFGKGIATYEEKISQQAKVELSLITSENRSPLSVFRFPKSLHMVTQVHQSKFGFPPTQAILELIRSLPERWKRENRYFLGGKSADQHWLPLAFEAMAKSRTPEAFFNSCAQQQIGSFEGLEFFRYEYQDMQELIRLGSEQGVEWYLQRRDEILSAFMEKETSESDRETRDKKLGDLQFLHLREANSMMVEILEHLGAVEDGDMSVLVSWPPPISTRAG